MNNNCSILIVLAVVVTFSIVVAVIYFVIALIQLKKTVQEIEKTMRQINSELEVVNRVSKSFVEMTEKISSPVSSVGSVLLYIVGNLISRSRKINK
jgi:uncharacterized protein YoxC